jgi:Cu(I)/Ag(I) efflux system membrane protein CusA/SilA
VFALEAQEGRLFAPLAFTKTYAMAASAGLAVTLVPVLMSYFIRGRIPSEQANPLSRLLIWLYRPLLKAVLARPRTTLAVAAVLMASAALPMAGVGALLAPLQWPAMAAPESLRTPWLATVQAWQETIRQQWLQGFHDFPRLRSLATGIGSEFMPELEEGDLLYMPTTLPGLSAGKAQELLQQTDRLIKTLPEVDSVFGKIGRADTATDPAPLTMLETTIRLKPHDQWRAGMTLDKLIAELERTVKFPGLTNAWVQPIKTRIDMLATGIKTPVGVKISGPDLQVIQDLGRQVEKVLLQAPGTVSAYSDGSSLLGEARFSHLIY